MANPDHIEWLLEGVAAWNARRNEGYVSADFLDADLSGLIEGRGEPLSLAEADLRRTRFERANISGADLTRANLWDSNLRSATLDGATLDKADLREADFRSASLVGASLDEALMEDADLRGADLSRSSCDGADLSGARLQEADLSRAHFVGALLRRADLRIATLRKTALIDARLDEADCRTIFYETAPDIPVPTDLSDTIGLTQSQLDSMHGDRGVILPEGLEYPDHWPEPVPPRSAPVTPFRPVPPSAVQARLSANGSALVLTSASVLEQIAAFRDTVRGNNQLAAERPELRESLLDFLDALSADLERLVEIIPPDQTPVTDETAEQAASWLDRFGARLRESAAKYVAPENVADAALPLGIILGCGAIGALLGGPVGFGAGSVFGNLLTNNLKPGAAAERIGKLFEEERQAGDPDG